MVEVMFRGAETVVGGLYDLGASRRHLYERRPLYGVGIQLHRYLALLSNSRSWAAASM
jgi:hypothetical protein